MQTATLTSLTSYQRLVLMADIDIRNYKDFIHVYTLSHLKEKKKENSRNEENKIKKQVLPYSFLLLFAFPKHHVWFCL